MPFRLNDTTKKRKIMVQATSFARLLDSRVRVSGLSQRGWAREMEKDTGIPASTCTNWFRGVHPKCNLLPVIAQSLECSGHILHAALEKDYSDSLCGEIFSPTAWKMLLQAQPQKIVVIGTNIRVEEILISSTDLNNASVCLLGNSVSVNIDHVRDQLRNLGVTIIEKKPTGIMSFNGDIYATEDAGFLVESAEPKTCKMVFPGEPLWDFLIKPTLA